MASSRISSFKLRELLPLGRGGMGSAHLAVAVGTAGFERLVVIKRLHEHLMDEPVARQRLIEEAELAGCVHHSNVVPVQHAGVDERGVFLVLDYVEGLSLSQLRRRVRPEMIPQPIVCRMILDALEGLTAIHTARDHRGNDLGILHRDVTPENILVGLDGMARLTDFGIAKSRCSSVHTAPSSIIGKTSYMAPEYIDKGTLGPQIDVYAMGVSLWTLLCGRTPFHGMEEPQVLIRILTEGVPDPDPDLVSPSLRLVLAKACASDPKARYASAADFYRDLDVVARGLGAANHHEVAAYVSDWCKDLTDAIRVQAAAALRIPSVPPALSDSAIRIERHDTRSSTPPESGIYFDRGVYSNRNAAPTYRPPPPGSQISGTNPEKSPASARSGAPDSERTITYSRELAALLRAMRKESPRDRASSHSTPSGPSGGGWTTKSRDQAGRRWAVSGVALLGFTPLLLLAFNSNSLSSASDAKQASLAKSAQETTHASAPMTTSASLVAPRELQAEAARTEAPAEVKPKDVAPLRAAEPVPTSASSPSSAASPETSAVSPDVSKQATRKSRSSASDDLAIVRRNPYK